MFERGARTALLIVLAVVLGLGLLFVGVVVGSRPGALNVVRGALPTGLGDTVLGETVTYPLQDEVLDKLDRTYYKKVVPGNLQDDSIKGMLQGLDDPYTHYLDPKQYALSRERLGGSYSGVGMTVESRGGFVTVVSPFKGSPAAEAGMKPGDVILAVDGQDTEGMSLSEVVSLMKGAEGTSVMLTVYHPPPGSDGPVTTTDGTPAHLPEGGTTEELNLVRKSIDIPVVETEIVETDGKKVAHIRLITFSQDSSEKLRQAVEKAVKQDHVDAVALDLRRNAGGLLDEAVGVSSIFIPKGVIVTTAGLHSPEQVYDAEGGALPDVPLYVLVDEFSASASEIVAGAIKDTKRGTLVGETTFGKGLVQQVEPLSNGGALVATTAVYLTPSGTDINKKGIEPNVKAPDNAETKDVDETLQKVLELVAAGR